ncbi:MAG: hypothetical protein KAH17_01835 [Bacteroidales bacterium]|nr:hypothetical protein [Bacteroidales bacterium]
MKNLFLLAGVVAMIFSSCTQELPGPDPDAVQEVIFTTSVDNGGFKSDPFNCSNPDADYAMVTLQEGTPSLPGDILDPIRVPTFYVEGILYTQAIKLTPGDYTVVNFLLYAEGAGEEGADLLVNAVPMIGSEYGAMVANPLPQPFLVSPFSKIEVPLGILCFEPSTYTEFGFTWFIVNETISRQKWFFGDFCTKFFNDYNGSLYGDDTKVDMPAIFNLDLYYDANNDGEFTNDELVKSINNEEGYNTTGMPLELSYLDPATTGDNYELRVSIYVKNGETFAYLPFGSWFYADGSDDMYTDAAMTQNAFDAGDDGVYDFILGNCNVNGADFVFAPYMNLPGIDMDGIDLTVTIASGESRTSYLMANLTGIGAGYDLGNGDVGAYCFDMEHTITLSTTYENIDIYSSLYPQNLPEYMSDKNWGAVNWLVNHLDDFDGYTWRELQQAMWVIEGFNGYAANDHSPIADVTIVNDMVTEALANGNGYQPMPGGWAAVVLEAGETIQTIFTIVDP